MATNTKVLKEASIAESISSHTVLAGFKNPGVSSQTESDGVVKHEIVVDEYSLRLYIY